MGYDKGFYDKYKDYLNESAVRQAHTRIFKIASLNPDFRNVVDFGCGMFNEFYEFANPDTYLGIDVNISDSKPNKVLVQTDYRKIRDLALYVGAHSPTAFVSLFSTENTAPTEENYEFYKKVFKECPSINSGLVSGFYYVSKRHQNPIGETGGIESYQTLEGIEEVSSDLFSEMRVILPVPSKMFGPDVFEVWKFFERKTQ